MSTTAILTYASRLAIQAYDAAGANLVGAIYNLQAVKITPAKEVPKISITNSESPPRRREFAPGNQTGTWNFEGIFDQPGSADQLWSNIMDNGLYANVQYYVSKPGLPGVANALVYNAKTLFTKVELNVEVSDDGGVLKFTAEGTILGSFTKVGTDVVYVTGI